MVKPKGEFERHGHLPAPKQIADVEEIQIAAWSRDEAGQLPAEQVHMLLVLEGIDVPIVMSYKSPDTLGFLIEELAKFRHIVWPDAQALDLLTLWRQE